MIAHVLWALAVCAVRLQVSRQRVRAEHEIRGPLAVARLALEGLEPSARVEAIALELRRAGLALDDLRGGRGGDGSEPVDLARVLAESAPAWRALAAAGGATISVEPSRAVVAGDGLRLGQACANLVANAVEHGGPHVRVRSLVAAGSVRVEVSDDGPGLPAPLHELLATARGRRTPRGHGLAITAAIAERHAGRLVAEPAVRGARLALVLPAHGPAPAGRAWPPRLLDGDRRALAGGVHLLAGGVRSLAVARGVDGVTRGAHSLVRGARAAVRSRRRRPARP